MTNLSRNLFFILIFIISCSKRTNSNIYNQNDYKNFLTYSNTKENKTWESYCSNCHNKNINHIGIDEINYWEKKAKKGIDTLLYNVFNGYSGDYGIMPPKGSCYECSEIDIKNSIYYLFHISSKYKKENNN